MKFALPSDWYRAYGVHLCRGRWKTLCKMMSPSAYIHEYTNKWKLEGNEKEEKHVKKCTKSTGEKQNKLKIYILAARVHRRSHFSPSGRWADKSYFWRDYFMFGMGKLTRVVTINRWRKYWIGRKVFAGWFTFVRIWLTIKNKNSLQ